MTQATLASLMNYVSGSIITLYERDNRKPDTETIERYVQFCNLSPLKRSLLLCAGDYPLTPDELALTLGQIEPYIQTLPFPSVICDYRSYVHAWNPDFANLFQSNQDSLLLEVGISWFALLFDVRSGLRSRLLSQGEWEGFVSQQVAQFLINVRRYNLPSWGGERPWLSSLRHDLSIRSEAAFDTKWEQALRLSSQAALLDATQSSRPYQFGSYGFGLEQFRSLGPLADSSVTSTFLFARFHIAFDARLSVGIFFPLQSFS